jgi:predicted Zn-dependent peptidase
VGLRELALLREPIPEVELERAKNILLAGIYMNVEKQSDRLEELTRNVAPSSPQIQCYGRIKLKEFEPSIRKISVRDVREEMESMFLRPPTFVLKGGRGLSKVWPESKLMQALLAKRK